MSVRMPLSYPPGSGPCDLRLPQEALAYRCQQRPPLTTLEYLTAFNITAWLYLDTAGRQHVSVNPNVRIAELIQRFGPAETPDAEVGFHSECVAAEWFRTQRNVSKVLQIFSERIPCAKMCGPLLRHYYPGVPWYYYHDKMTIPESPGEVLKRIYNL